MNATQNRLNQERTRTNPVTQRNTNMNSNHENQTSRRIIGGRKLLVITLLGLVLGSAAQADAMGGIMTTGTAVCGYTNYNYAVIFNPACPAGYYTRVWLGSTQVMHISAGRMRNGQFVMNYRVYNTRGYHWTVRDGSDQTRFWSYLSAGELVMNPRSVPNRTIGIVSGQMYGSGRQTHNATSGRNVGQWWKMGFSPTAVNRQLITQWQQWWLGGRKPGPKPPKPEPPQPQPPRPQPPQPLTDVSVNRHQVTVTLRDSRTQDGDRVELFLNGKYLRQVTLTNRGTKVKLNLRTGQNRFKVRALNVGTDNANTVAINITGVVKGRSNQSLSLKARQKTEMIITVRPR